MEIRQTRDGRPRSVAWVVYTLLAALGAIAVLTNITHLSLWLGEMLLILYARYLYRGGRWVLWFF